jgi:hypothetical protein
VAGLQPARSDWRFPRRPWQPLMRVIDVRDLDVEALADRVADSGADSIIVNAGGFVAWYATSRPGQYKNPHMAGDFLGEITEAAHARGLAVIGRIDISKGFGTSFRRHPDWFVVDENGNPHRYWDLYSTCFTGRYWQDENFAIVDEILGSYPLDALFYNFYYAERCHCSRCAALVLEATGAAPPPAAATTPAYERWRHELVADYTKRLAEHVHTRSPQTMLMAYHHMHEGWDPRSIASAADVWTAQISRPLTGNPLDPQPSWQYWSGEEARIGHALRPSAPPLLALTYSQMFASRRVSQPADRLIADMAQAVAHGASPCPALNGVPDRQDDPRPIEPVFAMQRFLARNEEVIWAESEPVQVSLMFSPDSHWYGPDKAQPSGAKHGHRSEFRGLYAALTRSRFPFDVCVAGRLDETELAHYSVIVLPAVRCLSDEDAAILDDWVYRGGTLISTADSGDADHNGVARLKPSCDSLAPLAGLPEDVSGAYLAISDPRLREAVGGTDLVAVTSDFWPRGPLVGNRDLELVGPLKNNAPEYSFFDGQGRGLPGLYTISLGAGRTVHIPWRIGSVNYHHSVPEYSGLIRYLLEKYAGNCPVQTDAPASVEVVYKAQQRPDGGRRWVLHLINSTTAEGQPRLETIRLPEFTVGVRCVATAARLALAGTDLEVSSNGDFSCVRLPGLGTHEIVVFDE